VECPHCGFKQQDYAAAKSTMCRQCGAHFSPSAPRPVAAVRVTSRPEQALGSGGGSVLRKQWGALWKSNRSSIIQCFDCGRKQEVSGAASSTICPSCSAHIDLEDYKISTSFSRTIRTTGEVHVTPKGDLNSTNVHCRRALIQGKMRGNLYCSETVVIDYSGKIPGRISAREVTIERKSDVQFFRRLRVGNIEIRGRMTGEIIAEGAVTIRKHAALDGNVTAKALSVEKGGVFSGQLVIGRGDLRQAELIPGDAAAPRKPADPDVGLSAPVPAT
jgi:cytoskeletal protein CcmA (bactofilin family)/ribosomal protein S27E